MAHHRDRPAPVGKLVMHDRTEPAQSLEARPPVSYRTFFETFFY